MAVASMAGRRSQGLRLTDPGSHEAVGNDRGDRVFEVILGICLSSFGFSGNPCREGFAVTTTKSTLC